jgi:secretion/DNA translocation related TadE-like protein
VREPAPEDGSATVWVLALALPVLTMAATAGLHAQAVLLRHRVEQAADRAALAGAWALAASGGDAACPAAGRIAATDRADVVGCTVSAERVTVELALAARLPLLGEVQVRARAAAEPGGPAGIEPPEVPPAE